MRNRKLTSMAVLAASLALAGFVSLGFAPVALAGDKVIFDSTVSPLPGNVPSVGAEAYSFTELGDEVTFAGHERSLTKVTVTLSSWGCQTGNWYTGNCVTKPGPKSTFKVPITFNIYALGTNNRPGALIATKTQTFDVSYRPSSDSVRCTAGRWFKSPREGCFNGLADNVTFDFGPQHIALPLNVVYGITYNTSHYGPAPIGESTACYTSSGGCPYDSLNIGLGPDVAVGSKAFPDTIYQNAVYGADYCDNGLDGVGVMRLDSPTSACWTGYVPAVQFKAVH